MGAVRGPAHAAADGCADGGPVVTTVVPGGASAKAIRADSHRPDRMAGGGTVPGQAASWEDRIADARRQRAPGVRVGILSRWGSCWIGVHWSRRNRRACINLVPFVTVWIVAPGGSAP